MTGKKISGGTVHELSRDLRKVLSAHPAMLAMWEDITPLARNEWICWIEDAKKSGDARETDPDCAGEFNRGKKKAVLLGGVWA